MFYDNNYSVGVKGFIYCRLRMNRVNCIQLQYIFLIYLFISSQNRHPNGINKLNCNY